MPQNSSLSFSILLSKGVDCFFFTCAGLNFSIFLSFFPVLHYQGGELVGESHLQNRIPLNELGEGGSHFQGGGGSGSGGTGYAYTTSCLVKGEEYANYKRKKVF